MDELEAYQLLSGVVTRLRDESYPALVAKYLGETEAEMALGSSGTMYQLEIEGMWDRGVPGDLRVIAAIDDGGFASSFKPLTDDFVMAPDGSFVGE